MQKKSRVTIRDVAKQAGVSHQTVSRVINNKGEISPETRDRILDIIDQLNYRPSRAARSLSTQRTQTIGIIVPNIVNPFFAEIVRGAQDLSRECDHNLFLCITNWDQDLERGALDLLASHPTDGIMLCSSRLPTNELKELIDDSVPILHDRGFNYGNSRSIRIDHYAGCRVALEYLRDQGHKNIAFLAGPKTMSGMSNTYRVEAYRQVMLELGLQVREDYISHQPLFAAGGYEGAKEILTQHPEVTALFAHNDLVAIGALKACRELNRRVPQDCAVIGHNNIPLASMVTPQLSSVAVDLYGYGQKHIRALFELMQNPDANIDPIYPIEGLIVRESSEHKLINSD